jgi:uncharacterized membrane protein YoaK (UPF0700 family)
MTDNMTLDRSERRRDRLRFFRVAAAHRRNGASDLLLGAMLAFVAGGMNAGGFLAIGQYTSHMTGIISGVSDNLVLGNFQLIGSAAIAVMAFTFGAAVSAILINWGRRNARARQYAFPIAIEAVLLLGFGILGSIGQGQPGFVNIAAPLLCFIMGLQNATITKISGARMRTTHVTGIVTDIGIELGKLAYWHRDHSKDSRHVVVADRQKLRMLAEVLSMFALGGVVGAFGFGTLGYVFAVPLAALLLTLALPPLLKAAVQEQQRRQ